MNKMTVCFVGVGSIAKRHIKNLRDVCRKRNINIAIDAVRRKAISLKDADEIGIRKVYTNVSQIIEKYDAVFITNPTEFHLYALRDFHEISDCFFIEKPIASIGQLAEAEKFELSGSKKYYVACPLRYNAVIKYIKEQISVDDVIAARSISSSYLPDWRPGQDYRKTYSARKDLGGGVSIDLIHEWDYLTYLFGMPNEVQCLIGKNSTLEIDSDDHALYIGKYNGDLCGNSENSGKTVELHLDYYGRKTIREIMLFTKDETIVGDIANNEIHFLKAEEKIEFNEERDDYQKRELEYFLDLVEGKLEEGSAFEHAVQVLKLTQGII